MDALLGRGPHAVPGKTRLTVINTQFLGDAGDDRLLGVAVPAGGGPVAGEEPGPGRRLQAVFLFDEADQYLPAVGKPATKGPMESLLKRARSAGVGLFLATQSPGDFDYQCRDQVLTWLIGRVKEPVAISKLQADAGGPAGCGGQAGRARRPGSSTWSASPTCCPVAASTGT